MKEREGERERERGESERDGEREGERGRKVKWMERKRERRNLILPAVGLNPQIPHMLAGILMLPPMSVPIPNTDPPAAISAPSPPDDPPGPRSMS